MATDRTTSTYMGMVLPVAGVTNDFTGEQLYVAALSSVVDSHDHTSGKGLPIRAAALSIDADVSFNMAGLGGPFNAIGVRALRFSSLGALPTAPADNTELLSVGGDLYWRNGSGQTVPITAGASLSATSIGGISGLAAPASAIYSSTTFSFRSNANVAALLDVGPLTIRDTGVSAFGVSIVSPAGLASAYSITLPSALPGSASLLQISSGGVVSASNTVPAVLAISGSTPAAPTVNGNWSAGGSLAYWKDAVGMVHVKGFATNSGAPGSTVFTLPAGFRPLFQREAACADASAVAAALVAIQANGDFQINGLALSHIYYFDGVSFLAEQ